MSETERKERNEKRSVATKLREEIAVLKNQLENEERSKNYYKEKYETMTERVKSEDEEMKRADYANVVAENATITEMDRRIAWLENMLALKTLTPEQYELFLKGDVRLSPELNYHEMLRRKRDY